MTWESMDTAPKDGTWILLRGRNAVGAPMIPVVAAWRPGGDGKYAWRDSAKLSDVGFLETTTSDEPVEWRHLP